MRDNRIDAMRGIAIIMVVLEHALGLSLLGVQNFILSFHMPLFFIISGILAKEKTAVGFIKNITKKARGILIPQMTLSVIALAYEFVVSYKILHAVSKDNINYLTYLTGYWFLHVMFQTVLIWDLISRLPLKPKAKLIAVEAVSLLYLILIPKGTGGFLYVFVTPVALGFYTFGFILNKKELLKKYSLLWCIPAGAILLLGSYLNERVLMYENQYGNVILFLITSLAGFFIVHEISYYLTKFRFINWMGRNSIIIYVVHFHIVQGTRGILTKVLTQYYEQQWFGILVFAVSFVIVLCVSLLCQKFCGFLFGRPFRKKSAELKNIKK